jgi:hypothetical protein
MLRILDRADSWPWPRTLICNTRLMPEEAPPAGQPEPPDKSPGAPEPSLPRLVHQPQEIAFDDPESNPPSRPESQLMVTPAARGQFRVKRIMACFCRLQYLALANVRSWIRTTTWSRI